MIFDAPVIRLWGNRPLTRQGGVTMITRRTVCLFSVLAAFFFLCSTQGPAFAHGGNPPPPPPPNSGGAEPSTFGHPVIYLGLLTAQIFFDPTCAPGTVTPPAVCVVLQPAPAPTTFAFPNLGSMVIPGNTTKNILLPSLTYSMTYDLLNTTASDQVAEVKLMTTITISSPALNLPSVINPVTGQPYNGTYAVTVSGPRNTARLLAPGEDFAETYRGTADGIQALDRELFLSSNLPASVVSALFQQPMTIQVGLSGNVQLMDSGGLNFGARFFGD